jgi:hypothetical protein
MISKFLHPWRELKNYPTPAIASVWLRGKSLIVNFTGSPLFGRLGVRTHLQLRTKAYVMAAVAGRLSPGRISKLAGSHPVHGCHPFPVRRNW